ncbi:response regulator [Thiospirochaeta perfilievii]
MKYWNVNINIANNEEKLLKKLYECKKSKHPIKILFIDIDNSKWDRLCGSIKTDPRIKDTKIAILTKFGIRGDVKHLSEIGISAYLTKPVKKADLHDSLLALINQKEKENQVITKHSIREMLWDNIVILVVDDNRINQKVATGILEKNGFIVDVVNSGKEAIEYLSERKYHIVLMDCNMPVLDGFETTKIIRSKESGVLDHSVPIVAMTANSSKSDREKCLRFGMSGFISKPIEPEGLIEIINRNLS